jgi:hypothetical protein
MKTFRGLIVVAAALIFYGCGKQQSSPPPAAAPVAAKPAPPAASPSASGGYLGTLVKGQQSAVKTIDVTSLNEELQLFNVQEGRYPKDLNELVTQHYIPYLPEVPVGMKLAYDATQGKVSVAPQ